MSLKKSSALKLIHGNPGKRTLNKNEPKFAGTVVMPSWLSTVAKREWKRVVNLLEPSGILQGTDSAALASYCQSYADWREAVESVRAQGQVQTVQTFTRAGVLNGSKNVINPWVKLMAEHQKQLLKSASLFGLDPYSRSKIDAASVIDPMASMDRIDEDAISDLLAPVN